MVSGSFSGHCGSTFPPARHFVVRGRLHRVSDDLGGLGIWSVNIAHHHGIIPPKKTDFCGKSM